VLIYYHVVDNSKITRIFHLLQEAREKGVLEIDLFNDFEKSSNIRVIKHRLNLMLEKDSVKIVNGRWYLCSQYWNMTMSEFQTFSHKWDMIHMQHKNSMTILGVVCMFIGLVMISFFLAHNIGQPNTLEECGIIFGVDINLH